jgi:hypothetical protein
MKTLQPTLCVFMPCYALPQAEQIAAGLVFDLFFCGYRSIHPERKMLRKALFLRFNSATLLIWDEKSLRIIVLEIRSNLLCGI